jgi:ribosomal protein S18 acetylase RimI-like enzyme
MEIRSATVGDVPAVLPLVGRICAVHEAWDADRFKTVPHPERMYEGWLSKRADDPRSVFLVAEHEGKIAAFLIGTVETELRIYTLGEHGWIHDLWVDEAYRNEGVGRQMTMLAVERFASLGVKQIRLQTAAANDIARKLFASCGFRPSAVEMLLKVEGQA